MISVREQDKRYIGTNLISLWDKHFRVGCYQLPDYSIYHHVSDDVYYGQGGPPPPKSEDVLCLINHVDNEVTYFLYKKKFTEYTKYIRALKNILFL